MLTPEQRRALPKKHANRKEIDAFYMLAAATSAVLTVETDLEARAKLIRGGGAMCACCDPRWKTSCSA